MSPITVTLREDGPQTPEEFRQWTAAFTLMRGGILPTRITVPMKTYRVWTRWAAGPAGEPPPDETAVPEKVGGLYLSIGSRFQFQ